MTKFLLSCLTSALVGVILAKPPAPVAPSPLVSSRARLCPSEPNRSWTLVHTFDGSLDEVWTAPGLAPIQSSPLQGQVDLWYDSAYAGVLNLPTNTPPGVYKFDVGRGPELTITVVAATKRKSALIAANGNSSAAVKEALASGALDITLAAGEHPWPDYVPLPENTVIHGRGAFIVRQPVTNYGTNWPAFVIQSQDVSIYGVTFVYGPECPGGMALYNDRTDLPQAGHGLVVSDCTFDGCNEGFYFFDTLTQRCQFKGGGAIIAPSGVFYRCTFSGPSMIDPFQAWTLVGARQMVCCDFFGTFRGPVHNAAGGPINDAYYSTVTCRGIVTGNNGNECWLCEGGALNRLLLFHSRTYGCESSVVQLDGGGTGGLIRDFQADMGTGLLLWGDAGHSTTGYVVQESQLPAAYFGLGAGNNVIKDSIITGWRPSRGNQTFNNPSPFLYNRKVIVLAEGPRAATNTITNTSIVGTPAGLVAAQGVTVPAISSQGRK